MFIVKTGGKGDVSCVPQVSALKLVGGSDSALLLASTRVLAALSPTTIAQELLAPGPDGNENDPSRIAQSLIACARRSPHAAAKELAAVVAKLS